jgi:hypothetical protein
MRTKSLSFQLEKTLAGSFLLQGVAITWTITAWARGLWSGRSVRLSILCFLCLFVAISAEWSRLRSSVAVSAV